MYNGSQTQLFAEYNRWMNDKLYDAALRLTDEQRKADRGAFFKSIHGTLNHLVWGDTAWLARLTRRTVTLPPIGTELYADFGELRQARAALDAEIIAWSNGVTEDWLAQPFEWKSVVYARTFLHPTWALVAQMYNHQTHHRGQVTTLLMQLGVDPGVTDIPLLPVLNGD
jgi:uncharacterized damage-inducible protein DinB